MAEQDNDIKLFRQLREQWAPTLSDTYAALLLRIEGRLESAEVMPVPLFPEKKKKKLTHKDRVRSFL